jgi:hypothetical protein
MAQWEQTLRDVEYTNNVTHALRQEPGILYPLAGCTLAGNGATEVMIENRFSRLALQKKTTTNGDTNYTDADALRRWVKKPGSSNVALLIDRDAVNSTSVEPRAPLVMETGSAVAGYHDDQFLAGWWGHAYEGTNSGTTAVPFSAGNKVAAAATGLTLAKLIELRMRLQTANVNFKKEKPVILLDAGAESQLFAINEYKSFDYNGSKPLVEGELKPWMGFRFMSANLGDTAAYPTAAALCQVGGVHRLPVIVPSGVARAVWVEFFGKAGTPMPDKQWSEQIYAEAESAVVRTDEAKAWFVETVPVT